MKLTAWNLLSMAQKPIPGELHHAEKYKRLKQHSIYRIQMKIQQGRTTLGNFKRWGSLQNQLRGSRIASIYAAATGMVCKPNRKERWLFNGNHEATSLSRSRCEERLRWRLACRQKRAGEAKWKQYLRCYMLDIFQRWSWARQRICIHWTCRRVCVCWVEVVWAHDCSRRTPNGFRCTARATQSYVPSWKNIRTISCNVLALYWVTTQTWA